jgi:hypothetical protein
LTSLQSRVVRLYGSYRRPRVRLALNAGLAVFTVAVLALAADHVQGSGWPLAAADPVLVTGAGLLFLLGYGLKAVGWQRLFARHERPQSVALAVAGGAASVTGVALPGRFDDAVRITVARRAGCRAGVRSLCLSLFVLGLVDAVALSPLASVGAGLTGSTALRVVLAVVAAGGIGAALILVALPRLAGRPRLASFRLVRWVTQHLVSARDTAQAGFFVLASWVVRAAGLALLLAALGLGFSVPLALLFLCAAAASSALPIAPAGAATQAGAGAASLAASGVTTAHAITFALAAQMLVLFAAVAVLGGFTVWRAGARVRSAYAFAR